MLKQLLRGLSLLILVLACIIPAVVTKQATATPTAHTYQEVTIIYVCHGITVGSTIETRHSSSYAYHPEDTPRWRTDCFDRDGDGIKEYCYDVEITGEHTDHGVTSTWISPTSEYVTVDENDFHKCR
ncbi:hypothetical protein C6496_21980 [Candidatus Poribacteria bacterium]|nr:MAG: hypothetical protein C6496_21980 [Candidatus Poribacteria bacterium]